MTTEATPREVGSHAGLGLAPEREAFERWLNPGGFSGNVSPWVEPGRYQKETHQLAWLAWRAAVAEERKRHALTDDQIAALTIMLDHYQGDPRTECLRPLVYGPNVRANPAACGRG